MTKLDQKSKRTVKSIKLPTQQMLPVEEIINLDKYPIADTNSPEFLDFTSSLKQQLDSQQYVSLPDFILPKARGHTVRQIESVLPRAHHNCSDRNCYLQKTKDPGFPDDHPRNILLSASMWMLAANLLPDDSPLKTLYYWDNMKAMVAAIVDEKKLYFNEDVCQPVNALCYKEGDRSAWHFDSSNAFTMTLMLQAPERGGEFEIIPNIRDEDTPNYDRVKDAALDNSSDAEQVGRKEGELCIFRGCNSLHRVSEVQGKRMRMMGVFVYEQQPGVAGNPEVNETVYGVRS